MSEKPTITINMDIPCIKCGKGGVVKSGYCLKCLGDILKESMESNYED